MGQVEVMLAVNSIGPSNECIANVLDKLDLNHLYYDDEMDNLRLERSPEDDIMDDRNLPTTRS